MNIANYVLLDASRMEGRIQEAKALNPRNSCLYEGDSAEFLGAVAPWLFEFKLGSDFANWLKENAGRKSWGIFFRSEAEPIRLYKHLRKYLIVKNENGKEMYFRFYDPKVLGAFLPTCDEQQLAEFFGPIKAFIAEDTNGLLIEYEVSSNGFERRNFNEDIKTFFKQAEMPVIPEAQIPAANSSPVEEAQEVFEEPASIPEPVQQDAPAPSPPPKQDSSDSGVWDFGY